MKKNMTQHFKIDEFVCKCGKCKMGREIKANIYKMAASLEVFRYARGNKPVKINSGYRCDKHNLKVGGVVNSKHIEGKAVDIWSKEPIRDKAIIYKLIRERAMPYGEVITYAKHIHYEVN